MKKGTTRTGLTGSTSAAGAAAQPQPAPRPSRNRRQRPSRNRRERPSRGAAQSAPPLRSALLSRSRTRPLASPRSDRCAAGGSPRSPGLAPPTTSRSPSTMGPTRAPPRVFLTCSAPAGSTRPSSCSDPWSPERPGSPPSSRRLVTRSACTAGITGTFCCAARPRFATTSHVQGTPWHRRPARSRRSTGRLTAC